MRATVESSESTPLTVSHFSFLSFSNSKRNFSPLPSLPPLFTLHAHSFSMRSHALANYFLDRIPKVVLPPFLSVPPSLCASRLPSHSPPSLWPVWLSLSDLARRWSHDVGVHHVEPCLKGRDVHTSADVAIKCRVAIMQDYVARSIGRNLFWAKVVRPSGTTASDC